MSLPSVTLSLSLRLPIPDIINWPSSVYSQHFIHTWFENESHFSVGICLHICLLLVLSSSGLRNTRLQGCSYITEVHCMRASSRCMRPRKKASVEDLQNCGPGYHQNALSEKRGCIGWSGQNWLHLSWNTVSLSQADIRAAWHILAPLVPWSGCRVLPLTLIVAFSCSVRKTGHSYSGTVTHLQPKMVTVTPDRVHSSLLKVPHRRHGMRDACTSLNSAVLPFVHFNRNSSAWTL